jgi:hypothetical protein
MELPPPAVRPDARDPAIGYRHLQQAAPPAVKRTCRGDNFFIAFAGHACFIPEKLLKIKSINPYLLKQDSVLSSVSSCRFQPTEIYAAKRKDIPNDRRQRRHPFQRQRKQANRNRPQAIFIHPLPAGAKSWKRPARQ